MKSRNPLAGIVEFQFATRKRWGGAKQGLIIALVVFVVLLVPAVIYFISKVSLMNGTTGDDSTVVEAPAAASAAPTTVPAASTATPKKPRRAAAAPVDINSTGKIMDLLVIDAVTKQPIPGIRVQTNGNNIGRSFTGSTGTDGHVKMPVSAESNPNYFNIRITGKDYFEKRLQWASYRPEFSGEVPTTCTLEMERTTKIGGKIVDDDGKPVAGATVVFAFNKKYANSHEQVAFSAYNLKSQIKSGADGSWSFNTAPIKCDEISVTAWDYHHATEDFWNPVPFSPVSKLYDGTGEFVLHKGVEVAGTVLDPQGNPLPGISVAIGQERQSSNAIPAQNTDAAGKFSYFFQPGHDVILTVQGKGFAPDLQRFVMGQEKKEVTFKLSAAHHITAKVVDAKGNPVRNANLYIQSWRGVRTLNNANFRTDPRGEFHWNAAPADAVSFGVQAPNQRGIDDQSLIPDQDNVIKLGATARVSGTVIDAQTGQPINNIHLIFGIEFTPGQAISWQMGWNADLGVKPGGKFDFTNDWSYPGIAVRIEAPGYMPTDSPVLRPDAGDANVEIKMKPGKDLIVTIRSAEGKPVEGATVLVALAGQGVYISSDRRVQNQGALQQKTGADGRADFSPQSGEMKVVAMSDAAGYAEVDQDDLAKSTDITLAPWSRIEGRMLVGSKPAAGQLVDLLPRIVSEYDPNEPRIQQQFSTKADDDGHFVLDQVPPGLWSINRRIQFSANSWGYSSLENVETVAGKTLSVSVGGTGRAAIGKVVLPPELLKRSDWVYGFNNANQTGNLNVPIVPPPMPAEISSGTREQQQKWMRDWVKTDAGKAYRIAQMKLQESIHRYQFVVSTDGSFRIDDMASGHYSLTVNLQVMDNQRGIGSQVGMGTIEFDVPEMPTGRSDEPLELPPVRVVNLSKLAVGDILYDLPMVSGNKDLKFSDFRGKYVLFHFRLQSDDVSGYTHLKSIYSAYRKDDRLVMLSITTNPGGGSFMSRMFESSSDIPWRQANVVQDQATWTVLNNVFAAGPQYPTSGAWLVDPEGKILAKDLRGDAIITAVTGALGPAVVPATEPTTAPAP